MTYRFYLDNNLYSEPISWDELLTTIKRDKNIKGILRTQDATLTFSGSAHDYLREIFDTSGYCTSVDLRIEQSIDEGDNWEFLFEGIIFISDIEWTDENVADADDLIVQHSYLAKVKVQDNSYFARINNNKNIGAFPFCGRSKNDEEIDPAENCTVQLFPPSTGVYQAITAGAGNEAQGRAFRVNDVFRFLVE